MNKTMSLLAYISIVWVFIEFQSLVDGPGISFVGGNLLSAGLADMLRHDPSSNSILQCCSPETASFGQRAVNLRFAEVNFSNCFNFARLTALNYEKLEEKKKKYQPISFLSTLFNMSENIFGRRIIKLFNKSKLFTLAEVWFRPKISCIHALEAITDLLHSEVETKSFGGSCSSNLTIIYTPLIFQF